MSKFDYDLFVIGGGSGGVRAARLAAQSGARVALAEEYRMGGTCVIRGCVPKKYMVYASSYAKALKHAAGYGFDVGAVTHDHARFMASLREEVTRLSGIYMKGQTGAGVMVLEERAEFEDAHTLRLASGKRVTAEKILIATGGAPWRPSEMEMPGASHAMVSNDVFDMDVLPKSLVINGGGYIGVEFAHVFAGLGVDVTVVIRKDRVLNGFDEDVRTDVMDNLWNAGVTTVTGAVISAIEKASDPAEPFHVQVRPDETITTHAVLLALGRKPNTHGLGLEKAGVKLDADGAVIVDAFSCTSTPNIWAVGDVTNRINLTPVAIREGHAFAETEFYNKPWAFDYANVPMAVFAQPEVGVVGLTEAEARAQFGEIDIYRTRFRPMKNLLNGNPARTLMKLVVRASDQRVLGVHIVGEDAAEMVQMAAIAVKMGATKDDFDRTCALHPTAAEELVTMRTKV